MRDDEDKFKKEINNEKEELGVDDLGMDCNRYM
jgi:hypothetical protein